MEERLINIIDMFVECSWRTRFYSYSAIQMLARKCRAKANAGNSSGKPSASRGTTVCYTPPVQ